MLHVHCELRETCQVARPATPHVTHVISVTRGCVALISVGRTDLDICRSFPYLSHFKYLSIIM